MVMVRDLDRLGEGDLEYRTILWELYFGDFLVLLMRAWVTLKLRVYIKNPLYNSPNGVCIWLSDYDHEKALSVLIEKS